MNSPTIKYCISILLITTVLSCTQCNKATPDESCCTESIKRGAVISELINNNDYMTELMDSIMHNNHGITMMTGNHEMVRIMMQDSTMQYSMMSEIIETSRHDSSMCIMMMDKTMAMCETDPGRCRMMMDAIKDHSGCLKSMKKMGICTIK